jgi:predicted glycosyltransferase
MQINRAGVVAVADSSRAESDVTTSAIRSKRIWIDLDNTPHVPFFLPIIRALEGKGHRVILTARDAFQVCGLAKYHGLQFRTVGRHYGANIAMKAGGTLWRAAQLIPILKREKPHIAMSHGSRSLEIVSALLGIPSMLIFDYEHAMRLPFITPALGVAPDSIGDPELAKEFRYGIRTYKGLKEDVYAAGFQPDPAILNDLGLAPSEILATIRPPATEAHYHNPEAENLFVEAVNFLGAAPGVRMVILPRTSGAQGEFIRRTWSRWCEEGKIIIPGRALDGLNLVWFSDLVVSGGGTMNREAAALGVPVYSIFRGKLGAVDRRLAEEGRLLLIENISELRSKLSRVKRIRPVGNTSVDRPALQQILDATFELMELSSARR